MFDNLAAQQRLYDHYSQQLRPRSDAYIGRDVAAFHESIQQIEDAWLAHEDGRAGAYGLPPSPQEFIDWFKGLKECHELEVDHIFRYLKSSAAVAQLALYTHLYGEVDDHFVDLVALAQLGMPAAAKLTMCGNLWEEMGRGSHRQMHIELFRKSRRWAISHIDASRADIQAPMLESLKNSNLLLLYGIRRPCVFRLLGALAIQEITSTPRFSAMAAGLARHGEERDALEYYEVHAACDDRHGEEWLERVLSPLMHESPLILREIALGALTHFNAAVDHYKAIWRRLERS